MATDASLATVLREQIIAGELAPGSRLSEAKLAERLGVSRNTLREAFRELVSQGLLKHSPHRGVRVVSPTLADVLDIYRARHVIETGALRAATPQHPALTNMRVAIEAAEAALAAGAWREVGTANMQFHFAIVALTDSPRLQRTFRNVVAELRLVFLQIDDLEALHGPFVARNRAVLTALLEQGSDAAILELEAYLALSERMVLGAYTRESTTPTLASA